MGFKPTRVLTMLLVIVINTSIGIEFILMAPKDLYYDSPTVVTVSAAGVPADNSTSIVLKYRSIKNNSKILNSTVLKFSSDSLQNWTVVFSWDYIQQLGETEVELVMSGCRGETEMTLSFAQNFGFIFIQTDKPIYTPGQSVKYRVVAVDEQQRLAKYNIRIEVKNHKQMIIDCRTTTAIKAFNAAEITLPMETPPGNWSITASFEGVDHSQSHAHTINFEVKEYVLPRFFTDIQITPAVITKNATNINITGKAMYFFKTEVSGTVNMQLGMWDSHNGVQLFHEHFNQELKNGSFTWDIPADKIFSNFKEVSSDRRLYVKVNVTEKVTLESDIIENTSTYISDCAYVVDFEESKKFFKPGFSYTLKLKVSYVNGKPAAPVPVNITSFFYDGQKWSHGPSSEHQPNNQSKVQKDGIEVPERTTTIKFMVTVMHQINCTIDYNVTKYDSPNKEYIHISVNSPKKNEIYIVQLNYTKPASSDLNVNSKDIITVLVLTKGQIVYTTSAVKSSNGITSVPLPFHLKKEVVPRMRIIVYYHKSSEYIMDSLVIETKHECLEEVNITLLNYGTGNKPKGNFKLEVAGSPHMLVGLLVVDKAVLKLNNNQALTRDLLFAKLGSHDKGSASGDGNNMETILSNSGLQHKTVRCQRNTPARQKSVISFSNHMLYDRNYDEPEVAKSVQSRETNALKPPQTTRNYFPESWLMIEKRLPRPDVHSSQVCSVLVNAAM